MMNKVFNQIVDSILNWSDLPLWEYIVAGIVGVLFVYQMYFYIRYMAAVVRRNRFLKKHPSPQPSAWPGVSIVVSARNEEQNLTNYLHALLEQKYPEYEVIVVNDGSLDQTQAVLEEYKMKYPRLHITFVPVEARVTSSKKLALTLAVKASKYEYLLLTDADCVPESNLWIQNMVQGFLNADQTQIVLGYSPYFPTTDKINRIIRYDTLFNGLQYLGRALAGHPYMGVGRNLMYRKSMFMQQHGFAGLLQMRSGDDDLFVNKVATKNNTQVVCTPDSLSWSVPKPTFKEWIIQKRRHLSVSPHYRHGTRTMLGIEPMTRGLWYLTVILCFVWASLPLKIMAAALFLIRFFTQMGIINKAARTLGEKRFGWIILWYDICLPVLTAWLLATQSRHNYTRW